MAYTYKPKGPPPFDAAAFTKALTSGKPLGPVVAAQYIEWKQWVESTDNWDGAEAGGIRDILNAMGIGVDKLKRDTDSQGQSIIEIRGDVQALKEAPAARPFP